MAQDVSTSQPNPIRHIDFNLSDLNLWMEGRSHEEIGRIITAIGLASQANDERYLEQHPFIDRIVYADGSVRKIIRGSGSLREVSGIDTPIEAAGQTGEPADPSPARKPRTSRGTATKKSPGRV